MSDDWCPENDGAYRMELAARERETIASLRARLEQAERERAHWRLTALMSRREGFRAGIEAAANKDFLRPLIEDQASGEWDDIIIDEDVRKFSSAIRALSPTDNTTTVAEADSEGPYSCRGCLASTWNDSDVCDDCEAEALAAQKGDE